MAELSQVKLQASPYIKNLFYSEKKANGYYLIIAKDDTQVGKGTHLLMQASGRPSVPLTTMLDLPSRSRLRPFCRPKRERSTPSLLLTMRRKRSRSS